MEKEEGKEEFTDIIAFDSADEAVDFLLDINNFPLPCKTHWCASWKNGCTSERCLGDCAHHT